VKLGLDYQKDDTTTSINYERIQSTNNKAHSYGMLMLKIIQLRQKW
jgi:hypothetical protein